MNIRKPLLTISFATLVISGLITGCANSSLTGDTYSRADARKVQELKYGSVVSVKPVVIEGNREGIIGNAGGTILGAIAGSTVGDGRGQSAATVIGAAVGGVLGQSTEEKLTRKQGQEIAIRMDSGKTISVVQEVKNQLFFNAGDRVRLLELNGNTRVSY